MTTIPRPAQIKQLRRDALVSFLVEMLVSCPIDEWQPGLARSDWFPRLFKHAGNSLVQTVLDAMNDRDMEALADDFRSEGWEVPVARTFQGNPNLANPPALIIIHAPGINPGDLRHVS